MARAPFQVLVIPYRVGVDGQPEYAVFRRADLDVWQAIAGGGEDLETPAEAARREAWEEAGLPIHTSLHSLRAVAMIPATHFLAAPEWGTAVTEIPEHAFAIRTPDGIVHLSAEHSEVAWLPYSEAAARFHWESNRAALTELHEWLTQEKRN